MITNKYLLSILMLAAVLQLQGCFYIKANVQDTDSRFPPYNETRTDLFFGLSKPDGSSVTIEEWNKFVGDYITPKFMDGFTVVDAYGQWQDAGGRIEKEKTKLVILIYNNSRDADSSLTYIISNYKRIFHQESVLKVTCPVAIEN